MAKDFLEELKDAVAKKHVIIGNRRTIKYLKTKELKLVILANNCPENTRKEIKNYANLAGLEVKEFDGTGKQLGIFCGKPFSIATISIKK